MATKKSITLTEERYHQLNNDYAGYCSNCNDITEDSGIEPDAQKYTCPVCEKNTVYGVEQAFIAGYIKIKAPKPVKEKTDKLVVRDIPTIGQLAEIIPAELNGKEIALGARIAYVEKIIDSATTIDLIPMTGWQVCGQWLVYGLENKIGFSKATALCSLVEKDFNRMRRDSAVNLPDLKKLFAKHYLTLAFNK